MAIIMNEFLPVPNIAPSGHILLRNNLSYVICVTFFWYTLGMRTSCDSIRCLIWDVVADIVL